MAFRRLVKKASAALVGAAVAAAALVASEGRAHAQQATSTAKGVTPDGKGIVGGALLGIEVVDITMGVIGVEKGWPYFVFGGLGGVAGGLGGFGVEKAVNSSTPAHAEPALYMLAGGMALIIPTLVVSLNATAYKAPDSDQKEPVQNQPSDAPKPAPNGVTVTSARREAPLRMFHTARYEPPHIPLSLVDVYRGRVGMGVPAVEVRPLYTQTELSRFGVAQGQEFRLPVFRAVF